MSEENLIQELENIDNDMEDLEIDTFEENREIVEDKIEKIPTIEEVCEKEPEEPKEKPKKSNKFNIEKEKLRIFNELTQLEESKISNNSLIATQSSRIIELKTSVNYIETNMINEINNAKTLEGKPMYSNVEKRKLALAEQKRVHTGYKNLSEELTKLDKAKNINESINSSLNFSLRVKEKQADLLVSMK